MGQQKFQNTTEFQCSGYAVKEFTKISHKFYQNRVES